MSTRPTGAIDGFYVAVAVTTYPAENASGINRFRSTADIRVGGWPVLSSEYST